MEQLRIFLSHSSQDKQAADQFVADLVRTGADVWYDEHNLGTGHLMDEIQRELGRRPIFIVLLSKAAFASKWVKRETDWAYGLADEDPPVSYCPSPLARLNAATLAQRVVGSTSKTSSASRLTTSPIHWRRLSSVPAAS